jgi:hypothetical protein
MVQKKHYKVYIEILDGTNTKLKIRLYTKDADDAKLGTQMEMRRRFRMELDRHYRITKTIEEDN